MSQTKPLNITIIGAGTIGLSYTALHLSHASKDVSALQITIHDTRPDLEEHILKTLPTYIPCTLEKLRNDRRIAYEVEIDDCVSVVHRLIINNDLESAVAEAHIVQEQGPEDAEFKTAL